MDWIQLAYDVTIGILTGAIIEHAVSHATIKRSFETEIQDLSRYLDALKQLVELYPTRECDIEIAQLIALSPRHESFRYLTDTRGLPRRLATLEDEIRQSVVAGDLNDGRCKNTRRGSSRFAMSSFDWSYQDRFSLDIVSSVFSNG